MKAKYSVISLIALLIFYSLCYGADNAEGLRQQNRKRFAHIKKLTAIQAYYLFIGKKIILADANPRIRFKSWHAFGAINLPADEINKLNIKLKRTAPIALY